MTNDHTAADAQKPWSRPEICELLSASIENAPGGAIFDGPLEAVGS